MITDEQSTALESAGLAPTRRTVVKAAWLAPVVVGVAATPAAASSPQKTTVTVTLLDSTGNGLEGGIVTYYYKSAWHTAGTTGPDGTLAVVVDGTAGDITFATRYLGAIQQLSKQDLASTSAVLFQTVPFTLTLVDHNGDPLSGGTASFYTQSWQTIGTTGADGTVTKELLPVSYGFRMSYKGSSEQRNQVTATSTGFQTGLLTSESGSVKEFWTTSWQAFPVDGVELLPSEVTLRMTDKSTRKVTPTPGETTDITL